MTQRPARNPPLAGLALLGLLMISAPVTSAPAGAEAQQDLGEARRLLDSGRPEEARELLDRRLRERPEEAYALLLRSTALLMLGETAEGQKDLDRALELDPSLREGWLNRGALALSEERYEAALRAFEKAAELSPEAPDNELNLGVVLLLQGSLSEAAARFSSYLDRNPESAEAAYLVASNYAMAGYGRIALQQLQRSISLDERSRLRVRTDPNFGSLANEPEFQELLLTDSYRPPPGAWLAERSYEAPFASGGKILDAVLDALQLSGFVFDRRIELTPEWALIWSEARIKIAASGPKTTRVTLSAPADRFSPERWREKSELLFRQIAVQLHSRGR